MISCTFVHSRMRMAMMVRLAKKKSRLLSLEATCVCPKAGRKVQEGVVEGVPSLDPRPRLARPKLHFFSMSGFCHKSFYNQKVGS